MQNSVMEPDGIMILDPRVAVQDVSTLKVRLSDLWESNAHLVIDASEVEAVDTAALQLLTAFVAETRKGRLEFTWQQPSAIFREKADLLGLGEALGLVHCESDVEEPDADVLDESQAEEIEADEETDDLCPVF